MPSLLDAFAFVAAIAGGFLTLGSGIWVIWELLRSKPPSDEELARAQMRSYSWPTENGDAFAESHAKSPATND